MKTRQLVILVSIVNLTFNVIFLIDAFINRKVEIRVIEIKLVEKSSSYKSTRSHRTNILVDDLGNRYNVPGFTYAELSIGDPVSVYHSAIFNMPNIIKYTMNNETRIIKVGVLNSSFFGVVLCTGSLIIYLLLLFLPKYFKDPDGHLPIALLSSWLVVVVGSFYYFFQP